MPEEIEVDIDGLKGIVGRFDDVKVLVIGDFMLDKFIQGSVSRISPEVPVPVVDVVSETFRPGGAANVVSNIRAMGGDAIAVGVVGNDSNGRKLVDILKENDVDIECILVSSDRPTTVKTRVIAKQQQIVRIDNEKRDAIDPKITDRILEFVEKKICEIDAILISDYDKGVVTTGLSDGLIAISKRYNKPIVVYPKVMHFLDYKGVTIVNSSLERASTVTGISQINETSIRNMGQWLLTQLECEYVLLTRGDEGMTLFDKRGNVTHIPSIAKEIYNVTGVGAGDTATSLIALSLAAGVKSMISSAILSNTAAGIVIGKVGSVVVSKDELLDRLDKLKGTALASVIC